MIYELFSWPRDSPEVLNRVHNGRHGSMPHNLIFFRFYQSIIQQSTNTPPSVLFVLGLPTKLCVLLHF
jgi:hypothetical protein